MSYRRKQDDEATESPAPKRPELKYVEGQRVYSCLACRDCGYRYVLIELDGRRHAATTPCFCEFGEQCATANRNDDAARRANGRACRRLEVKEIGPLRFSPYDGGVDPSDPRVKDPDAPNSAPSMELEGLKP